MRALTFLLEFLLLRERFLLLILMNRRIVAVVGSWASASSGSHVISGSAVNDF